MPRSIVPEAELVPLNAHKVLMLVSVWPNSVRLHRTIHNSFLQIFYFFPAHFGLNISTGYHLPVADHLS